MGLTLAVRGLGIPSHANMLLVTFLLEMRRLQKGMNFLSELEKFVS